MQAVKNTVLATKEHRQNCLDFGLTISGQGYINDVKMYTVYQVSKEYKVNMNEIPQMRTLALLPGAKPHSRFSANLH